MRRRFFFVAIAVFAVVALVGCEGPAPVPVPSAAPSATITATPVPTGTPTATSTPTAAPTATATHSPTPSPTPTPRPHPLEISVMRSRTYPGSDLVVEQTLARAGNFQTPVVSYQSDGYKITALLTIPDGERPAT